MCPGWIRDAGTAALMDGDAGSPLTDASEAEWMGGREDGKMGRRHSPPNLYFSCTACGPSEVLLSDYVCRVISILMDSFLLFARFFSFSFSRSWSPGFISSFHFHSFRFGSSGPISCLSVMLVRLTLPVLFSSFHDSKKVFVVVLSTFRLLFVFVWI